jgi:hypothetical protein
LTQQLLAFARKQALDPRAIDVNQLLAALDPMLRRTLGEHIEIEPCAAPACGWPWSTRASSRTRCSTCA